VTEDVPADVRAVLAQLFAEGRASLRAGDRETAVETVTTAEAVATNELPEGAFRDRLLHGCERVRVLDRLGRGPGESVVRLAVGIREDCDHVPVQPPGAYGLADVARGFGERID